MGWQPLKKEQNTDGAILWTTSKVRMLILSTLQPNSTTTKIMQPTPQAMRSLKHVSMSSQVLEGK